METTWFRRINRNIVECKDNSNTSRRCVFFVLIETSWNVKVKDADGIIADGAVLIETSWNVKVEITVKEDTVLGINRNIVECKEWCKDGKH